ncbi:MAG: lysine exporter LysO family protein, partial [Bacteroidota bacterium]|nr:lysine exporter LysO family protein [Bacteroidota bacterium]
MLRWIPYTFVRTVLFFIGGIVFAYYFPESFGETACYIIIAALTILYFLVVFSGRRIRKLINPGWIALPLIFFFGYGYLISRTESRWADHLLGTERDIEYYEAVITRYAEEKARSWKLEARVTRVHSGQWQQRSGKIILYFSKADFPQPF